MFALPLLAAFGLKWVHQNRPASEMSARGTLIVVAVAVLALIVGILAFARVFPYAEESWPATIENGVGRAVFLVAIIGAVYLLQRASHSAKSVWLGVALLLLLGLDALTHVPQQNPSIPVGAYGPISLGMSAVPELGRSRAMVSPLMRALLNHAATKNAILYQVNMRRALYEDCNLPENMPKVDGFFSLHLPREMAVEELLYTPTNFPEGLADFLGASEISSANAWFEWSARPNALPWVTAGQRPVFADRAEILAGLASPSFDPRRTVYLPVEARLRLAATNAAAAEILSTRFSARKVALDVAAPQPAVVVVAQADFPCWRASVDGAPTRIWPANYAFQAVEIPAGRHRVELAYHDNWFVLGAVISGITLMGCLIWGTPVRWHRKKTPGAQA
jgi:hypothetical protein